MMVMMMMMMMVMMIETDDGGDDDDDEDDDEGSDDGDNNGCRHRDRALQWRHNEYNGVSNHQPHDCLLKRLFRRRSKRTSKLRVTGLCAQRASNAEMCPFDDAIMFGVNGSYMMTSSNGKLSALLAICVGNSPVTGEFSAQRPVTRSFDVFFHLRLNERLSKQS